MAKSQPDMKLMPTVKLSLGSHVVVRHKKNGTFRVLFAVQDNRPFGWPPTVRLPLDGKLHDLPLDNPDMLKAILRDADGLRQRLVNERSGTTEQTYPSGSLAALADKWENMSNPLWSALKPRTRRTYSGSLHHIRIWSEFLKHCHVSKIKAHMIREWLESGLFKPGFAKHHRSTLSRLLSDAVEDGLIEVNPVSQMAKRKVLIRPEQIEVSQWASDDVAMYAETALQRGWVGGAILVRALWESPTRLYDVPLWTRAMVVDDHATDGGVIAYKTSKSDSRKSAIAILTPETMALIRSCQSLFLVTRPDGVTIYREGKDDDRLSDDFRNLRKAVVEQGGRYLVLRHLRHMSQTDAVQAGATKEQIGVSSSHSDDAMLLGRYRQDTIEMAREVARKRGIIGTKKHQA